jgi:hypothetical protein
VVVRAAAKRPLIFTIWFRDGLRRQLLQLILNRSNLVVPSRRLEVSGDPDDNRFLERRCGPRRLPGHGQSEAFSEILEENYDHNAALVYRACGAALNHLGSAAAQGPGQDNPLFLGLNRRLHHIFLHS